METLVLSPAQSAHAGLAIAAARADGIGVLDLEWVRDEARARQNFEQLLQATAAQAAACKLGLRLTADQLGLAQQLQTMADTCPLCLILVAQADSLPSLAHTLKARAASGSRILLEITDVEQLNTLPAPIDGLIAKGHEAGAWGGQDTSYILAQKLLGRHPLPVYLRGGLGRHSTAACVLNGAAGVVLDDQVLLLDESPLSPGQRGQLTRLNGAETELLGEQVDLPCRVFGRRDQAVLNELRAATRQLEAGRLAQNDWLQQIKRSVGWSDQDLLPLGQGIGLAAQYAERYGNVGRLLKALREQLLKSQDLLAEQTHLGSDSALARSHGTRYPLAQGPMTRVSDSADFALAVADAGALPFLALALMRGEQVDSLLQETSNKLADKPWGVGLLGFVPQALRQEQCAAVFRHKPDYALIAGGRPDQAAEFEAHGIPAYLHAPAPALLKLYLDQGARRFVFEGRECGGHIGPIASFPLWEQMIEILLRELPQDQAPDVHILFAGGISDARSGAMMAALTAPLAARGIKVGMLMGTAYLFTREIVETGAIVPGFQREALACRGTVSLETGPGHATRCARTDFSREFFRQRSALMQSDKSADAIRDELEDLNMGRLRVASKGRDRDAQGQLVELDESVQQSRGMYMIGQVATLRDEVLSIEELHRSVTDEAAQQLAATHAPGSTQNSADPSDIAIIGIGMILPQIDDADGFWNKVLHQQSTITEVPKERWDQALYFDPDKNARDKVYAKWGGFLDEIVFDPTNFGIAPNSMKSIDPMQLLSLEATARALRDARLGVEFDNEFDRENTSIILGAGGGIGDLGMQLGLRSELPRFVEDPEDEVWDRLPEWTNESFAGVLLNVSAGRIANRMDFGGVNFTVDAACGSSLAAITLAAQELESGRSNVAIAGGVDTVQGPFGYLCFSKTQALSPQGQARSFDKNADGIVISEGVCVTVMKRLADAQRDGDRIYAVIKAASGSSDGRALGMTAPLPKGQQRALRRAYKKAGFSPATLGLVEAHGTGTPVGDQAEAETVTGTLQAAGAAPRSVALGSVKTLVGHTKCAAGVTGLVKTALSLYHRVLPAHYGVDQPIDVIADPASPAYLLKQPRPWLRQAGQPRRAAVSAFGFGGTNFHAVLEEYRPGWGADAAPGATQWPVELCLLRADSKEALQAQLSQWKSRLAEDLNPAARLAVLAASWAEQAGDGPVSLCMLVEDFKALRSAMDAVLAHLQQGTALPDNCQLNLQRPAQAPRTAVLFPGQGAQYPGMGRDAALYLSPLREAWEQADEQLQSELGESLSAIAWPASAYQPDEEAAQRERLTQTCHAQPALGALEMGLWRWFALLGLEVHAVAGHSYGEYAALMAAGVLSEDDFLRLSATRGRVMAEAAQAAAPGGMAAVMAARDKVETLIAAIDDVSVANHNAPQQTVITGRIEGIEAALQACEKAGLSARALPVSGAFHSPLMASAQAQLSQAIDAASFAPTQCALYSNSSGQRYPEAAAEHLKQHLLSPVEFVRQIEVMQADGVELFVELGPKNILQGMLRSILPRAAQRCVAVDRQDFSFSGLLAAVAELYQSGHALRMSALFSARGISALPAAALTHYLQAPALPRTAWMLAGGYARPADNPVRSNGLREALDHQGKQAAKARKAQLAASAPVAAAPAQPATPGALPPMADGTALSSETFAAYQQTMRQFLQLQESVMTQALGHLPAAGLPARPEFAAAQWPDTPVSAASSAALPGAPAPASNSPAAPTAAQAAPLPSAAVEASWDAQRIQNLVLDLTAEKTGYPQDMLDLSADLEADLGIDSIKRVELAGGLQKALPEAMAQAMQTDMERYTRAPSLQVLIDQLCALAETVPTAATADTESVPAVSAQTRAADLDIAGLVLDLVAEKTGYPQDMLDRAADLEADLGIDSIKRVEIVGALQKQLPEEAAQAMQADLERYTRARTLNELIERLGDITAQVAPTTPPAEPVLPATAAPSVQVSTLVLDLVAEKTGYPQDMLDLEADLEADLGIDSIKRVEIVGALQKQLPADLASAMQDDLERYTRARSLQRLISAIEDLSSAAVPKLAKSDEQPQAPLEGELETVEAKQTQPGVPRYVIRPRQAQLPQEQIELSGLVVLVDGPEGIRLPLQERIAATGAPVVELLMDDPRALKNELALAIKAHGPVQAVMHLGGLSKHAEDSFARWRKTGTNTVGKLFTLLKALDAERETLSLIAATRLGGTLGREAAGEGHVLAGGAAGVINCYRQEYPQAIARTIDFDGQTEEVIAEHLFNELLSTDPHREIGYLGDTRYTVSTLDDPLRSHDFAAHLEPQAGWVILATGGARGITAEILLRMAQPGVHYVLVGRTPLADEDDLHLEHDNALQVKGALIADARVNGALPKPAEIDRQVEQIMAAREVRDNLQRLVDAGAQVDYRSCDVRDVEAFSALIEDVYAQHQRIDGVIHAAGVIEDKLIADKTMASFDRVFGTKTDSAWILAHCLKPESLKWMAFFTSVAGRYGNRGQADYAAANEALNRFAWQLSRRWKDTRVMAINWGPWDAGMASEAVKAKFREQGILPIPVAAGAQYFLDELAYGPKSEVELVVGEGPWARYDQPRAGDLKALPLIRDELRMAAGGSLSLSHHFSVASDPYLADHCMDGKAVLPAAAAAEWMAQLGAAGWDGWQVAELRDLKVLAGVVMDPQQGRAVELRARASSHSQLGEQMLGVEMCDADSKQVLYRAQLRLVERLPESPALPLDVLNGEGMTANMAYADYLFHGPRFQLLDVVSAMESVGVDAQLHTSSAARWLDAHGDAPWLFDPGLLDCGPQLAILWSRKHLGKTALPSAFGSVCRYGRDPMPRQMSAHLRIRGQASDQAMLYDVFFADHQGRVRLAMRDIEGTASAALNRLAASNA